MQCTYQDDLYQRFPGKNGLARLKFRTVDDTIRYLGLQTYNHRVRNKKLNELARSVSSKNFQLQLAQLSGASRPLAQPI